MKITYTIMYMTRIFLNVSLTTLDILVKRVIAGDLNSRVGNLLDYVEHDSIAEPLLDVLSHVLTYDGDVIFPKRYRRHNC